MAAPNGGGADMVWVCWSCRTHVRRECREAPKDWAGMCGEDMERVPRGDEFLKKLRQTVGSSYLEIR
jgi:hypothetical protein